MEPKDWIAVAQVYASLAIAVINSLPVTQRSDRRHEILGEAAKYETMALTALRAAGVEG